ncbi:unnamed protein product [Microthlaspi erraticum]|uniref:Uncharacterized protein n=1 Tax=Microthlaspi erraticum TaxID=1685480 RepID=A0A6D2K590_9BRAS|nr:unnamed protein product [Microthlaspi erraticum]
MDFIKTSSLRALIELTFQRNWNGLIWMSRKGVTTKRVKTVQTALSRNRAAGWPKRSAKSIRLKSRPKFKPPADTHHDPGIVPRSAKPHHSRHAAHDHAARAGNKPRGRATFSRTTADGAIRAGKARPASGREIIGQSSVRPAADREPSGHDRSDTTTTISGRPTVPTPRSTRSPF